MKQLPPEYIQCTWDVCMESGNRCQDIDKCGYGYQKKQLPPGQQQPRTRLWDRQFRLLWDSTVDSTPAYRHIIDWVNATIDDPDGTRWSGWFHRCPEGIRREAYTHFEYLRHILRWPTPPFEDMEDS